MKKLASITAIVALAMGFTLSGCRITQTHVLNGPPGQVKKRTGSTSARQYAPGQQKKLKGKHKHKHHIPLP